MARSPNINSLEKDKFRDGPNDTSKVAVTIEGGFGLLGNVQYDDEQTSFPSDEIEILDYYLAGVLQAKVEITYLDSTKTKIIRRRRISDSEPDSDVLATEDGDTITTEDDDAIIIE